MRTFEALVVVESEVANDILVKLSARDTGTLYEQQSLSEQFCRALCKEEEGMARKRRWEKSISDWTGLMLSDAMR